MATSVDFWHNDRGDRSRIHNPYRHLAKSGFTVPVFYTGEITKADRACLRDHFPDLDLHLPDSTHHTPTPSQASPPSTPYRHLRVWLKTNLPPVIVKPVQATQRVIRRGIKMLRPPQEPPLSHYVKPSVAQDFAALCATMKPDAVLIHYIHQAYLLDNVSDHKSGGPFRILDTLDVMHLRTEQFHTRGERHWANVSRDEEQDILQQFDLILAIQRDDALELEKLAAPIPVITVGHSLPIVATAPPSQAPLQITYFGTGAAPNRQALSDFLHHVWTPLTQLADHTAQLHIAGTICDTLSTKRLPRSVVLRGYVDDVTALYEHSDIVINPVTFGGGLKIKTVEALCHGAPLVTTAKGVEGLEISDPPPCIVCANWEEMLESLQSLIENANTRERLSESALRYAQDHFSQEAAYGSLRDYLNTPQNNAKK